MRSNQYLLEEQEKLLKVKTLSNLMFLVPRAYQTLEGGMLL
jgi:hypothetical protein